MKEQKTISPEKASGLETGVKLFIAKSAAADREGLNFFPTALMAHKQIVLAHRRDPSIKIYAKEDVSSGLSTMWYNGLIRRMDKKRTNGGKNGSYRFAPLDCVEADKAQKDGVLVWEVNKQESKPIAMIITQTLRFQSADDAAEWIKINNRFQSKQGE